MEDIICHRGTEALNWFNVFFLCFRASVAIIKILLCCGTQGQRIIVLQKDQAIAPVAFLTHVIYFTMKDGTKMELAIFFNNLTPAEEKKLEQWLDPFEAQLFFDPVFRSKVKF